MWWEGKESEEDGMAVENDGEGAGDFGVARLGWIGGLYGMALGL